MGKSAQLGLHTWLPDAMEGPTPVSALIHAATMVTAGVFLVIRCSPIFEYSSYALNIIAIVGALTAFVSATIALTQHDIKKVIAYSTCSQLGYMFFACGLSNYYVGLFHLFNHAFFKALLFLSAGSVIHSMRDEQDMRRLGGVSNTMPITYICVLIGSLSLSGFPFLSGFYSKDVILETALGSYTVTGYFAFWLGSVTAFLTAFYSFRLFYIGFMQETSSLRSIVTGSHESGIAIIVPLTTLALGSIFSGYYFRDVFIGLGSDVFAGSIFVKPESLFLLNAEFIPFFYKSVPLVFSLTGIFLSILLYSRYGYVFSSFWLSCYPLTHFLSK
jgi:proton-translocating NADH-quinone oxidoreductase chain L